MQWSGSQDEIPRPLAVARSGSGKSLISDEPWDCYHLECLLPLKETYRESTEFGFLLRHYWIPATVLTFRQSSQIVFPDGHRECQERQIQRKMARCRANECLWRETISPVSSAHGNGATSEASPVLSEMLCSYDCYEQTYASDKPILFTPPTADGKTEARRAALVCLPMLVPPGPVPMGFCWYAKVGDDYMNFRLEAEERLGETSVLVIRREGRFTTGFSGEAVGKEEPAKSASMVIQRKGVTLFAWSRGAVLEDRSWDQVVEAAGHSALPVGTTQQVVTRLVRSCPESEVAAVDAAKTTA